MNKEELESLLIDYIDGKLNATDRKKAELEISRDIETKKLYEQLKEVLQVMNTASHLEPSEKLSTAFDSLLAAETKTAGKTVLFSPMLYKVAAAVTLLIVGLSAGYWISQYQRQQEKLAVIERQVQETKRMMMAMLDNQQSASQRVVGATVALHIKKADPEILDALIKAMNEDPNTNVRMAALDALGKFHDVPAVRKALIASLSTQKDPIVQISLIRLLVEMNEKSTIRELERITTDENILKEVKDEAHAGLLRLS
jgi:hypothetical protein